MEKSCKKYKLKLKFSSFSFFSLQTTKQQQTTTKQKDSVHKTKYITVAVESVENTSNNIKYNNKSISIKEVRKTFKRTKLFNPPASAFIIHLTCITKKI